MNPINARPNFIRLIRYFVIAITFALALPLDHARATMQDKAQSADQTAKQRAEMIDRKEAEKQSDKVVKQGVAVEVKVAPLEADKDKAVELMAGEDARIEFKINDAATQNPISGARISAWMSQGPAGKTLSQEDCEAKVKSFIKGTLRARPDVDLNTFYILTMNKESSISVLDPLLGFGTTKLYTLIFLKGPGEDWVIDEKVSKLFVTIPSANVVAVAETNKWKVISNIEVGFKPSRIALQNDRKYVWVAYEGTAKESGVAVIDTDSLKIAARIQTGAGRHDITFSPDDRFAFITNESEGTVSIIDVTRLAKIKDVPVGKTATSIAYSPLSKAIYITDKIGGNITAIDLTSHEVVATVKAAPGIAGIKFDPAGRWGFVANAKTDTIYIIDSSANRIAHTVTVGKQPDQFTFTDTFAYVRSKATEKVTLIKLGDLGKTGELSLFNFGAGQGSPEFASEPVSAGMLVAAPGGSSVVVANPTDKTIYYYMEGMAAPMGSFTNYKREPKGVMVLDRSLRETSSGVFSTTARMPASGSYDVLFFLDSPRVIHCFQTTVKPNPEFAENKRDALPQVEYLIKDTRIKPGEQIKVRFRLSDRKTKQPKPGLRDVSFMTFLAPGIWQHRQPATHVGEGVYEAAFTAPQSGMYYVYVQIPSLKARFNHLPYMILNADAQAQEPVTGDTKSPSSDEKQK